MIKVATDAMMAGRNQYPPAQGVPELRSAIAAHQLAWYGLSFSPDDEVLVTTGATEAIAASLLALCEPGDEVVMFEPSYDSYAACASMAGATPRLVRLHPPDWSFDPEELGDGVRSSHSSRFAQHAAQSDGQGFYSRRSLSLIAELCCTHDVLALTDEVYEHLVFDGAHVPLATQAGNGRADPVDFFGRQDVLVHRMEGWLGGRSGSAGLRRAGRQSSSSPTPLVRPSSWRSRMVSRCQQRRSPRSERRSGKSATFSATGWRSWDHRVRPNGTFFATTDIAPLAPGLHAYDFYHRAARTLRCGGHTKFGVLRRGRLGSPYRAAPSLGHRPGSG